MRLVLFLIFICINLHAEETLESKLSKIPNIDQNVLNAIKKGIENNKVLENIKSTDDDLKKSTLNLLKLSICTTKLVRELEPAEQQKYMGLADEKTVSNSPNKDRIEKASQDKAFAMQLLAMMMEAQNASIETICDFSLDYSAPSLVKMKAKVNASTKLKDEVLSLKNKMHPSVQLMLTQSQKEAESYSPNIQRFKEEVDDSNESSDVELKKISMISRNNFMEGFLDVENGEDNSTFDRVLLKRIIEFQVSNSALQANSNELNANDVFVLLFDYYLKAEEYFSFNKLVEMDTKCVDQIKNLFELNCKANEIYTTKIKKHTGLLLCADDNASKISKECNYKKFFLR